MNACVPFLFCEYCYNLTHHQSEYPFILHYMVDEDEIVDNEEEHTEQVEHAQVTTTLESEKIVDNNEEEEKRSKLSTLSKFNSQRTISPKQILIGLVTWK
jgi:hypothetical protein